jgi:hypothetical protein
MDLIDKKVRYPGSDQLVLLQKSIQWPWQILIETPPSCRMPKYIQQNLYTQSSIIHSFTLKGPACAETYP